jgi:hypothetical protein
MFDGRGGATGVSHMLDARIIKLMIIIFLTFSSGTASDQTGAWRSVEHDYIYDIQADGSVRCTWATTIIPQDPTILYTISFRGGETRDYQAVDSLSQVLDADVNEQNGQRTISLLLAGYKTGEPYSFNLSFTWNGLLSRAGDRYTLFTSVNVGEPQAAEIVVVPPSGSRLGTSMVTLGNITAPFRRELASGRDALLWRTENTGNQTEVVFRASFYYSSPFISLVDNLRQILLGLIVILAAALLLGYRRRIPAWASRIKERI